MNRDILDSQPHAIVQRDGVEYTLLGTAHVSANSVEAVKQLIGSGEYDCVAVELDPNRLKAIRDPDALARTDLVEVLRSGKTPLFAANLALASYQRRLAEQLEIEPGAELKAAVDLAQADNLQLQLIDRDIGLTFKRTSESLSFWGRAKLASGILVSLLSTEEVEDHEIEKLKQGDMLESSFGEFAASSPALYDNLIAQRDQYMAANLREIHAGKVLAVVGAGHLAGLEKHLREDQQDPAQIKSALESAKPKSKIPWFTLIFALFLLGGFAIGFYRGGLGVGTGLILHYVAFTMIGGALGCLVAGGHPLSILGGALSSPLTPLHPALASGTISGLIEAWVRKPTHSDFMGLRDDLQTFSGWWKNRVSRVLLNFFLTSMGTAIGVWSASANLLVRLFH